MNFEYDKLVQRCPALGHEVPFSYCRKPAQETPCRRIFDCWWESFDIKTYIEQNYSTEIQHLLVEPPKPKMVSLLEIIEQAKKRTQTD
ncbi:MAG: hypothetical protein GX640_00985 [Fibrobacter sp.]|nr:hypothetical protein [Fibrobacter sp.]